MAYFLFIPVLISFLYEKTPETAIPQNQAIFVEIPRFELGQTEPKSVVLPLHHISIPVQSYDYFVSLQKHMLRQYGELDYDVCVEIIQSYPEVVCARIVVVV